MILIKHKPFYSLHPLLKNLASFAVKLFLLFSFASFSQNPIIIAHRGASAYAPENTISAFEKAIEMGAVIIETDVHQTKDSVVVIMHDLSVDRTTNGEGLIKDISSSDFKQLSIKQQKTVLKENPPTLEEAIIAINGRCKLLIELKKGNSYYPNIEKHIVDLIAKYNAQNWISTIHSFEKEPLINFAKRDSSINLQKLIVFNLPLVSFNFDKHFIKDDFNNCREEMIEQGCIVYSKQEAKQEAGHVFSVDWMGAFTLILYPINLAYFDRMDYFRSIDLFILINSQICLVI